MDRWVEAADWIVWQLCGTLRPQRLHRRLQGHPPGRRLPVAGLPRRAGARLRATSSTTSSTHPIGQLGDARRHADRRGRRAGPACPRASRSRSATSTRTSPRRRPRPSSPGQMVAIMGTSTCHVMNADVLREVPGMCGVVDGGIVAGQLGLRGRPERRRRHLRLVRRAPRVPPAYADAAAAAGRVACTSTSPSWPREQAGRRARPGRARLAQRQPVGARRPRAVRRWWSG